MLRQEGLGRDNLGQNGVEVIGIKSASLIRNMCKLDRTVQVVSHAAL